MRFKTLSSPESEMEKMHQHLKIELFKVSSSQIGVY